MLINEQFWQEPEKIMAANQVKQNLERLFLLKSNPERGKDKVQTGSLLSSGIILNPVSGILTAIRAFCSQTFEELAAAYHLPLGDIKQPEKLLVLASTGL
jgi:hypothetical protein